MIKIFKLSALGLMVIASGCVVVDPSRSSYAYSSGTYYGGGAYYGGAYYAPYIGGAYYSPPPVRVYSRPAYFAPPPRVVVVRERPHHSKSNRRGDGRGSNNR